MRLNHLVTREDMECAQVEARTRTKTNYDECLSNLIDKYYDTPSQRVKNKAIVEINRTFERMKNEDYSPGCIRVYTTLWRYVKEGEEKRGTQND